MIIWYLLVWGVSAPKWEEFLHRLKTTIYYNRATLSFTSIFSYNIYNERFNIFILNCFRSCAHFHEHLKRKKKRKFQEISRKFIWKTCESLDVLERVWKVALPRHVHMYCSIIELSCEKSEDDSSEWYETDHELCVWNGALLNVPLGFTRD